MVKRESRTRGRSRLAYRNAGGQQEEDEVSSRLASVILVLTSAACALLLLLILEVMRWRGEINANKQKQPKE